VADRTNGKGGDERPIVGLQVTERVRQVDVVDLSRRIGPGGVGRRDPQLDDRVPPLAAAELAGLVGRHRHEPGLDTRGVAQRGELSPGAIHQAAWAASWARPSSPQVTNATRTMSAW